MRCLMSCLSLWSYKGPRITLQDLLSTGHCLSCQDVNQHDSSFEDSLPSAWRWKWSGEVLQMWIFIAQDLILSCCYKDWLNRCLSSMCHMEWHDSTQNEQNRSFTGGRGGTRTRGLVLHPTCSWPGEDHHTMTSVEVVQGLSRPCLL